jgi:hypothetical protein
MRRRSLLAARERDVGGAVQERLDVGRVDLDLHEPGAERVAVDEEGSSTTASLISTTSPVSGA